MLIRDLDFLTQNCNLLAWFLVAVTPLSVSVYSTLTAYISKTYDDFLGPVY